jgi:2-keto-4-pentenoate hydratase/2-oxohepta-3-ene-1,7-dioic acid hydratase in catechol pathway
MKLLRYGPAGQEKPGMLDRQGRIRDLSAKIPDIAGAQLSPKSLDELRRIDPESLPLVPGTPRIGPCVGGISKLVCVGLNYSDHAAETGAPVPTEPILFMKATTAICGPNDDVILPRGSKKSDWEVELGIVIGTKASYVPKEKSLDHVAGYCIVNDVSEREYQMERLGQWTKGKSADTFAPIGPWMVSKDEVADPQSLDLFLDVNGARRQRGNTRTMIFGVQHLVSYISQFMTLLPGDVIPTGTPPGVGLGMKPPVYLKPGDVMHLGIGGLGEQTQKVVASRG